MVVRVHLFGPEAALAGASHVDVTVHGSPTSGAVLDELTRSNPHLTGRIAVNHAFAAPDQVIREGDEVALIGMVSGG